MNQNIVNVCQNRRVYIAIIAIYEFTFSSYGLARCNRSTPFAIFSWCVLVALFFLTFLVVYWTMASVAATNHPETATKSGLWQFFTFVAQGPNRVYTCNICKVKFVGLQQGNIVSILTSHLRKRHPECMKTTATSITVKQEAGKVKAQGTGSNSYSSNTLKTERNTLPKANKNQGNKTESQTANMTSATPTKAKDKERIVKLLHESILHLCKVSVSGPGDIEVDGIVCITQPNDSDIVVKVHETFSNVHNSENKDDDGKSPLPGEKRKAGSHGESNKTPRKDNTGERQKNSVSRRLMGSDETLDLTGDDEGAQRQHRSPHRARNSKSDVIDLTSGRDTPAPQIHITQVRSLGNQPPQRFNSPGQYNQRFVNYRPRGGSYHQQRPRQRFVARGNMAPPLPRGMTQTGGNVVPISGPIPHRGYPRNNNPNPVAPRASGQVQMAPGNTNIVGQSVPPNGAGNMNSRAGPDITVHGYKGLKCKYKDCGFSCSNKYYLETHVLQHFDSSPFSCNEEACDFKTKNKQNLYQHYKLAHGANNPQFCFKCIKAFKSPEALNIHARNCEVMSIRCDHCGDNIMGLMAMARHLTEVYIADSTNSDGQTSSSQGNSSPGSAPSPGQTNQAPSSSPAQSTGQSPLQSPSGVPDMSAPLNIIPDLTAVSSQHSNQGDLIHQELEKLEQMSSDMQQQQQQQQQQQEQEKQQNTDGTESHVPELSQSVNQSLENPVSTADQFASQLPQFEVLNQPITTSDQEPITLQVPVDINSDLSLPPGAEAITLELVPLISNENGAPSSEKGADMAS